MAWKTPHGHTLNVGDRVVWIREDGRYDWDHTGTVSQCLPVNDDDDGEIRIDWDETGPPLPGSWYYPWRVEKITSITALDRMAKET